MRVLVKTTVVIVVVVLIAATVMSMQMMRHGLSAHDQPTHVEALIAGMMRHYAVPARLRDTKNPLPLTPDVLAAGRAHFADHCATCHGNDGKGATEIGPRFYPKVPDMTRAATQNQSDGELFATIENGVRMTAMPGWGDGTPASERTSWELVHFIRHLPKITPEEIAAMEKLNPKTPADRAESEKEDEFLNGH